METIIKRSRFSEEQIIAILKEQKNGLTTKDVCRKAGISSATFYKWKATDDTFSRDVHFENKRKD